MPGLEHRIGGLEKADGSGNVSYDPANHERMVHLRAAKIAGIARDIPPVEVDDETGDAEVLVLGWGSTFGAIAAGVRRVRARGQKVAHAHLVHLNPFPADLGEVLGALPTGAGARGQPRPAARSWCGPSSWSTPSPSTRSRACPSGPPRSRPPS